MPSLSKGKGYARAGGARAGFGRARRARRSATGPSALSSPLRGFGPPLRQPEPRRAWRACSERKAGGRSGALMSPSGEESVPLGGDIEMNGHGTMPMASAAPWAGPKKVAGGRPGRPGACRAPCTGQRGVRGCSGRRWGRVAALTRAWLRPESERRAAPDPQANDEILGADMSLGPMPPPTRHAGKKICLGARRAVRRRRWDWRARRVGHRPLHARVSIHRPEAAPRARAPPRRRHGPREPNTSSRTP